VHCLDVDFGFADADLVGTGAGGFRRQHLDQAFLPETKWFKNWSNGRIGRPRSYLPSLAYCRIHGGLGPIVGIAG
jgi:hypothetical protein